MKERDIEHIKRLIEHDMSLIALCRIKDLPKAETLYEKHLVQLYRELGALLSDNPEAPDAMVRAMQACREAGEAQGKLDVIRIRKKFEEECQ